MHLMRSESYCSQPPLAAKQVALLTGAILMMTPLTARAELDPKLNTPYQLDVVLQFADNAVFTKAFSEQVQTELRELLQQSYGKLAQIKVQSTHPLLPKIDQKGLQKALDVWDLLGPSSTHFLLVDHSNGAYRIQERQHDGGTGLPSPHVRSASTSDAGQLARLGAMLVEQDFALSATVTAVKGDTVEVTVQGGGLVENLGEWFKPKQVLAVCRIAKIGSKVRSERMDATLLEVQSALGKGVYSCSLHTSLYGPRKLNAGPGVLGYRCVTLATVPSKLSFQLLAASSDQPLSGLQIHASPEPFSAQGKPKSAEELSVDAQGRAHGKKVFGGIAFVRVLNGSTILAEFPVALVDHQPITCRVSVSAAAAKEAQLEFRLHQWHKRILEDLYLATDRSSLLKSALAKSPDQALQLAKSGLETIADEIGSLQQEQFDLADEAEKAKVTLDLSGGKQGLKELGARKKQIAKFIDDVQKFIKEDAETKKLQSKIVQAQLLEEQAEYDQAIEIYKKVLAERPDEKNVASHLQKLQSDWLKDRGPEHKKARDFVYETWPEPMGTFELKAKLPQAKQSLALFAKTGDRLTPRKMLKAALAHALSLKKRLDALKLAAVTEDNRNERKTILALTEQLQLLYNETRAWVDGKDGKQ